MSGVSADGQIIRLLLRYHSAQKPRVCSPQEVHMAHDTSTVTTHNQGSRGEMAHDEVTAFFDRRQAAYDNLDAAALASDYAPDCVVDSPMGGTHQGRAAIQTVLQAFFNAFRDMKTRTESLVIDGHHVAQVLDIEGTHIGVFLGLPPTGKPFRFVAVLVFDLQDRQIVRERRIYDFTGLLVQIGALKAKPV